MPRNGRPQIPVRSKLRIREDNRHATWTAITLDVNGAARRWPGHVGPGTSLSDYPGPAREGTIRVSGGLPNAVGQDPDAGYGKAGAESLFGPRLGGAGPGASGCRWRPGGRALRPGRRPDGGYRGRAARGENPGRHSNLQQ